MARSINLSLSSSDGDVIPQCAPSRVASLGSSSSAALLALLVPLLGTFPACSASPSGASHLQGSAELAEREGWSSLQAAEHAARYNDPDEWQLERLADDSARMNPLPDDQVALPFPHVAFPTPEYSLAGRTCHGLSVGPLELAGPAVGSYAAVNRPLDHSTLGPDQNLWEVIESEPLFVVVANGAADLKNVQQSAISRSHPHYFFQGTFAGAAGEVDWVAIRMADGTELAVVNGRVFDLAQGNLILVRQQADGSIRLYQDQDRLEAGTWSALHAAVAERLQIPEHASFIGEQFRR